MALEPLVGTSITTGRYVDRVDHLRAIGDKTTTRFLSVEPQHTPISLAGKLEGIAWVIQGGESGPVVQSKKLSLEQFNQRRRDPLIWPGPGRSATSAATPRCLLPEAARLRARRERPSHGAQRRARWRLVGVAEDLRLRQMPAIARSGQRTPPKSKKGGRRRTRWTEHRLSTDDREASRYSLEAIEAAKALLARPR